MSVNSYNRTVWLHPSDKRAIIPQFTRGDRDQLLKEVYYLIDTYKIHCSLAIRGSRTVPGKLQSVVRVASPAVPGLPWSGPAENRKACSQSA
jgi:hypothetical protein